MRNTFSLDEILAYIECSRRSSSLDIPAFLDSLEPELLDSVMALVAENEEENCLSGIDELAESGKPIFLADERVRFNRHVAQSMKELLGNTGVRILIDEEDSLGGLRVHMARTLQDLEPMYPLEAQNINSRSRRCGRNPFDRPEAPRRRRPGSNKDIRPCTQTRSGDTSWR